MAKLILCGNKIVNLEEISHADLEVGDEVYDVVTERYYKNPVRIFLKGVANPIWFGEDDAERMRVYFESSSDIEQIE